MKSYITEGVKTVSESNAEDFDKELNRVLKELSSKGIKYTMQLAPSLGYTAFVVYKQEKAVPETIEDEFRLGGEVHRCIECPFYVRPTDGRVKFTRCPVSMGITRADRDCCDEFYRRLLKGEINLVEVG